MSLASALYVGHVRHRRAIPPEHAFRYPLFMTLLDLSELDRAFAGCLAWSARGPALAWFRRADYLGDPAVPLDTAVRDLVEARTGRRPAGPVRLLTHLRMFGVAFNPVSFYYCHDASGERIEAVVAEVNNTPWNERHCYVLARDGDGPLEFETGKEFHVSPFMDMDAVHRFRFTPPGASLVAHIENHRGARKTFDARLTLERRPLTRTSMAWALLRYPFMTLQVLAAIYWEALRLLAKGARYHAHPRDAAGEPLGRGA